MDALDQFIAGLPAGTKPIVYIVTGLFGGGVAPQVLRRLRKLTAKEPVDPDFVRRSLAEAKAREDAIVARLDGMDKIIAALQASEAARAKEAEYAKLVAEVQARLRAENGHDGHDDAGARRRGPG